MSEEQLKVFLAKVKCDSTLQQKLKTTKSPEDVETIAKEHGHEFGSLHLSQLCKEELDGVGGGKFEWHEADAPLIGYPIDDL
ncbi:Nitrogen fixation protein of unknown function [Synechococcus sp. MIT S9509]|uniref:Nif11-like leader peptide family natural product precursor n=1 Tax=unclassified Synechococcus TaxID=2626047 RepID=UPI0007BB41A0|nr:MULTISPECIES: Nif11-like leader peptide family natural product precursor [unclassified Synechococcus]KZR82234.1 Nitrogen fixation protein of unknown function [Synechococcus sp. MIT S9504]KZR86505.1 Nitrogen fixation protein of unknown function [Synechococcus sp. MIT S9509]